MFEDMQDKWKKSLAVVKDLKELEFVLGVQPDDNTVYKICHPEGKYSVWTANGFWFIALHEIDGDWVNSKHRVSKFGALGKIVVWWYSLPHIKRLTKIKKQQKVAVNKFW